MEKIKDFIKSIEDDAVIAVESGDTQYFFGTKSDILKETTLLDKEIKENEKINEVISLII